MKKEQAKILITGLFVLILFLSSYLYYAEVSQIKNSSICNFNSTFSCDEVANSEYSKTLGVSNSLLGIFLSILVLILINLKSKNKILNNILYGILFFSSFYAIRFLYIQFITLGKICIFCLIIDIAILVSFFLFWKFCKD